MLVCRAAAPPGVFWGGDRRHGAFDRPASRLVEMQSVEYLGLEHRAD
jgi:cell division protein ZapE